MRRGIVPEHLRHRPIYLQKLASHRAAADRVGRLLNQRSVAVLRKAQRALRHHAVGKIQRYADHARNRPIVAAQRLQVRLQIAAVDLDVEGAGLPLKGRAMRMERPVVGFRAGEQPLDRLARVVLRRDARKLQGRPSQRSKPTFLVRGPQQRRNPAEQRQNRRQRRTSSRLDFVRTQVVQEQIHQR